MKHALALFHDGIISGSDELGAEALYIFLISKGSNLNMKKFVGPGRVRRENGVVFLAQRRNKSVGVFLLGYGRHLQEIETCGSSVKLRVIW